MRRCAECGGALEPRHGDLKAHLEFVGTVIVPDIDYEECAQCHDTLLGPEAGKTYDLAVKAREAELVGGLAERDFVSAAEAMRMLGMSRQTFHKNGRIRRGFIYSVPAGGRRRRYHRGSVERFLKTGDGRFPLPGAVPEIEVSVGGGGRWLVVGSSRRSWHLDGTVIRDGNHCEMELCR